MATVSSLRKAGTQPDLLFHSWFQCPSCKLLSAHHNRPSWQMIISHQPDINPARNGCIVGIQSLVSQPIFCLLKSHMFVRKSPGEFLVLYARILLVKIHLFASYKFQVTAASFNSCWKSAFVCNLSHQWLSRQDMLGVRTHVLWPSQKWSKVVKSKVFILQMQVQHLPKMWVCWARGVSDRNLCWRLSHHDPQTSEGWSSKPSQGDHVDMACYDSNMQHQLVHELSGVQPSNLGIIGSNVRCLSVCQAQKTYLFCHPTETVFPWVLVVPGRSINAQIFLIFTDCPMCSHRFPSAMPWIAMAPVDDIGRHQNRHHLAGPRVIPMAGRFLKGWIRSHHRFKYQNELSQSTDPFRKA